MKTNFLACLSFSAMFSMSFTLFARENTGKKMAEPKAISTTINNSYTPTDLYGTPVYDSEKKLSFIIENASQGHERKNCVLVKVSNIKGSKREMDRGRIRVAVWDSSKTYAQEGIKPHRASSFWAKESIDGQMVFKICGLVPGKNYSFFAHFDADNSGRVTRFLGIPKEQFIFSNAKNQGKGPGLSREGFSAPKFNNTLVKYVGDNQEILLPF